jgi:pyruvate dehydrogenase complex dehydrogenase (E1) component
MPAKPVGVDEGIIKGLYRFAAAPEGPSRKATILFSGTASEAALQAHLLATRTPLTTSSQYSRRIRTIGDGKPTLRK